MNNGCRHFMCGRINPCAATAYCGNVVVGVMVRYIFLALENREDESVGE
ncbi:MAG: hypothetical protein FWE27_04240 [Defluviitaleaceae bacterium]|nr:hypothetical protein [Defluviitaleaceae bacterium]